MAVSTTGTLQDMKSSSQIIANRILKTSVFLHAVPVAQTAVQNTQGTALRVQLRTYITLANARSFSLTLALDVSRFCMRRKNASSLKRISDTSTRRSSPHSDILQTRTNVTDVVRSAKLLVFTNVSHRSVKEILSLSLHLMAIFPGEPGLAGIYLMVWYSRV